MNHIVMIYLDQLRNINTTLLGNQLTYWAYFVLNYLTFIFYRNVNKHEIKN